MFVVCWSLGVARCGALFVGVCGVGVLFVVVCHVLLVAICRYCALCVLSCLPVDCCCHMFIM